MAGPPQPVEPAPRVLRRLMAERGYSLRKLAAATKGTGKMLGASSIGNIARGDDRASVEALEALAKALGVAPETFAEVRLAYARRQLDERKVGLDQALRNLRALTGIADGAEASVPAPPERLRPASEAPGRSGRDRPARARPARPKRRSA